MPFGTHIVQKEIELPSWKERMNYSYPLIIGRWVNICSNINCLGIGFIPFSLIPKGDLKAQLTQFNQDSIFQSVVEHLSWELVTVVHFGYD